MSSIQLNYGEGLLTKRLSHQYYMHQPYDESLKIHARNLRNAMTNEEIILWSHLRRRQILQKPLYGYILDFYSPEIKLAIEIDGGQHYDYAHNQRDRYRDSNLSKHGINILRYTNLDISHSISEVLEDIHNLVRGRI